MPSTVLLSQPRGRGIISEVVVGYVVLWLFFVIVWCCVCGAIAGSIASKRDASYGGYFALGFFFGVIGVIAAAFAGNGGRRPTTVINNYYAVNADGSHTLMSSGAPLSRPGALPYGRSSQAAAARRTQWGCTTPGCSAYHQPTRDAFCRLCNAQTRALPLERVRTRARADLDTRACGEETCAAVGERTSNLVCSVCRRDTVLGWAAPPPRTAAPEPSPVSRSQAAADPVTARGPAHLLTRRCTNADCTESVAPTSNLVCRACRRDTAMA